ncbi:hypothetical protein NP493_4890g00000 [Ridgeia piscesae]|uniref:PDZ domain-containing protein n=1 Tax=Ridgeia piscesae TaxID=27915 RepID=A0AAD9IWV6_RIDPI|nr:hypothetical protein NP493_4890g00000 [Ridgeia piscesae]
MFDQLTAGQSTRSKSDDRMVKKEFDVLSTVRMPAAYYDTVPARRANKTPRRPLSHVARPHSAAEVGSSPTIRTVHLRAQTEGGSRHKGRRGKLGFSIRGGAEHGMGIYVSSVDEGSAAEKQGLAAGDQICSVNQISFKNTSQDEAARVPAALESTYTYTWVDPRGRVVSPPPATETLIDWDDSTVGRRSGLNLLNGIRGGREFGLGIFVTGVDRGSAAELGGLKASVVPPITLIHRSASPLSFVRRLNDTSLPVQCCDVLTIPAAHVGEQILDVNGESFLNITHADAVSILQTSKHLVMTTRDIGKLPLARTTYEHAQWTPCDSPDTGHAGDTFSPPSSAAEPLSTPVTKIPSPNSLPPRTLMPR